jgi:hypothetical protein
MRLQLKGAGVFMGVEAVVEVGVRVETVVGPLMGLELAVAVVVCIEAGVGVCTGISPRLQDTSNVRSNKDFINDLYLLRLFLIR